MLKKHRKLLFFVISFFIITVGGSFLYKEGVLYDSPISLPVLIPTLIPLPQLNSYSNDKYKFAFSYPRGWEITYWDLQDEANLSTVPEGSIRFQVEVGSDSHNFQLLLWENRSNLPATSWVRTYLHEEIPRDIIPSEYNTRFLNYPAIRFTNESKARGIPLEYIFFNKDSYIYELIFERNDSQNLTSGNTESFPQDYQSIIDTFAFTDSINNPLVLAVINDVSSKTGVDQNSIAIISEEETKWNDSSLGCSKEGEVYSQVITPGYIIVVEANGNTYEYHTDLHKRIVSCSNF